MDFARSDPAGRLALSPGYHWLSGCGGDDALTDIRTKGIETAAGCPILMGNGRTKVCDAGGTISERCVWAGGVAVIAPLFDDNLRLRPVAPLCFRVLQILAPIAPLRNEFSRGLRQGNWCMVMKVSYAMRADGRSSLTSLR
jgi:hypothetical protein